ncbi:Serine/threonine-protein kinase 31 [Cricetulus griseus]|uniref:Serine/threonine-protein kinase 31 n=1 Tax=Cricetulus griseus TaxID=10029 RepID=G3H2L3_CRIGR|nr:Serine/threonine-protein kinase 31 [Cricetulus griseus]
MNKGSNVSLAKIKQDQKLIEENEKLKTEKEVLLENYKALELKVEQTSQELQQEKTAAMDLTKHLESTLKTCVGTRLKNLAAKVELLKEIRHINISIRFGNDLSDAMQVLDEGSFTTLESLNELEKIWAEYNVAQEKIQTCHNENEGSILIAKRNEVQQKLFVAVDVFILEVDELPLEKRLKTLQDLSTSLEAVYGKAKEGNNSEEILRKFCDWQCSKREQFTSVRSETEASLQHLVAWFQSSQKEQDVVDKEIILSTYSQVLQKIYSEERFIATLLSKYKDSVESDDHDGTEIEKIKQEITQLRNSVFQEIYHEREEYNSGGLLTMSLERDLLDTEPMKELSSKRPLVCSEVDGQPVLLKGYSVDVDTEGRVIQRAASYHRACGSAKEESGLLPLIFLFLCKSDPVAYLMVPYYPKANLSAVQASMPLTSEEALKVMKGVARGLHTLHSANIIHGSLHQNNVFALNREQGIVGDFDFTKSELSVQNQEFETNEDGIPKVDQFHLGRVQHVLRCSFNISAVCWQDTRSTQNKKTRKKRLQWHQGQRLRVGSSGIMIAADCQGTTWGSSPGSADPNPSALAHLSGIFCYTGVTAVGVAVVSFYML